MRQCTSMFAQARNKRQTWRGFGMRTPVTRQSVSRIDSSCQDALIAKNPNRRPMPEQPELLHSFGALRAYLHAAQTLAPCDKLWRSLALMQMRQPHELAEAWLPYIKDHFARSASQVTPRVHVELKDRDLTLTFVDSMGLSAFMARESLKPDELWASIVCCLDLQVDKQGHLERLGVKGMDMLASATHLHSLIALNLTRTDLTSPALLGLIDAPHCQQIQHLILDNNSLTHADLCTFLEDHTWPLRTLSLESTNPHPLAVESIAYNPHTRRSLEILNLRSTSLQEDSFKALMMWRPEHLHSLNLAMNDLSTHSFDLFAQGSYPALERLDLGWCRLDDEHMAALCTHLNAPHLHTLLLPINQITAKGLTALTQSRWAHTLTHLCLSRNPLALDGIKALCEDTSFPSLRTLDLSRTQLTAECIDALLECEWLHNLTHLNLGWCNIRNEGALALAASGKLHNLKTLDLSWSQVDQDVIQTLRKDPACAHIDILA